MSTGGIALLIAENPHRFQGLTTIGTIIFILDICFFLIVTTLISSRFFLFQGTFTKALNHVTEALFVPTFWLSIATTLTNTAKYGVPHSGPWLVIALRVVFWIYCGLTFCWAIFQYYCLFKALKLTLQSMTPAWLLPIFPIMLAGTAASAIAPSQESHFAIPILLGGLTFQGLGFTIAVFMYSQYIGRLMTAGLPSPETRPGMFIAVGPPSFTGLALIGMADAAATKFPGHYVAGAEAVNTAAVLKIVAVFFAIWLWAVAFFFFSLTLVSVLRAAKRMSFHLIWWSFVFPNTGFIILTISIGTAIRSPGILWTCTVATVVQICVWLFVGFCHIRAVWVRQIVWPGKDEDHEE